MIFISLTGSVIFLVPLGLIVIIIFTLLKWKRAAILFVVAMAGEIILDLTLKGFYRRARPEAFFDYPLPASYSYPSGHALASFCFYSILAWLITTRLQNQTARIVIWTVTIILIFLIGISRIYLGVHYASDVIAGYSAAFGWILTVVIGDSIFNKRKFKTDSSH
jgi:undecaprenyl-diphosphatase